MAMTDPFVANGFTATSLSMAINIVPNMYGRVNEMGLMPNRGVATRTIIVEEKNGVLTLLPTQPVGAPGTVGSVGKRKIRSFVIPHIPHDDVVLPEEVQGIRSFGSENSLMAITELINDKLATMANKHDITLEHLRMGALKGIILDADGSTLYNLYTEFGITAKTVNFALATGTTDIRAKCLEVKRHIEDNLLGESMRYVHCLCSAEFYDSLTNHANVKTAFQYFQQRQNLSGDFRTNFEFAGVIFEEYRGVASDAAGNTRRFIASGEAHFFPMGTNNTFATFNAPADFNEAANTIGMARYAKMEPRKFGRGWDIHTQSNPLPMCARPGLLVKGTSS